MKASILMDEIREIRDKNSKRHLNMTAKERKAEADKSIQWFILKLEKEVKVN